MMLSHPDGRGLTGGCPLKGFSGPKDFSNLGIKERLKGGEAYSTVMVGQGLMRCFPIRKTTTTEDY